MKNNHLNTNKLAMLTKIDVTPLGVLYLAVSERGLIRLDFQTDPKSVEQSLAIKGYTLIEGKNSLLEKAENEILEYFFGNLRSFSTPIDYSDMPIFQTAVLQATQAIPYGSTQTYAEIARQIGHPRAARAVGQAEARNPIPIIIPCHRVIGSDGKLHGYGAPGSVQTKHWLLEHERAL